MEENKDDVTMDSECDLSSELMLQCKKENPDISQPSCESEDSAVVDLNGDCSMLMLKREKDNIGFSVETELNEECCEGKDDFKTELGHNCSETHLKVVNVKYEEVYIKTEKVENSRNQHDTRIRCKICKYKSNSQHDIDQHLLAHWNSPKSIYSCKICNYVTKDKDDLETHMQTHLDSEDQGIVYNCEFCNFKAMTKSSLQYHLPVHQCKICGVMKEKQDLKSHMELHKDTPETKRFQCKMCGFKALCGMGLSVHMAKMHQCPLCEYSTNIKGSLKRHMITHEERPRYCCKYCAFQSRHRATFKNHLRSVHNIKEWSWYQCKDCNYKTRYKNRLDKHMEIHGDISM